MILFAFCAGFVQASLIHSESFSLVESASVSRSVFANEGDRIVGNFSVSNIPTWTDIITGKSETVQYAFKVSKIEGPEKCPTDIVIYEVYQTQHATFDVICEYTGDYRFRFNVGSGEPDVGVGSMEATLNYEVVKNSSNVRLDEKTPSEAQSNLEHPTINTGAEPSKTEPFPTPIVVFLSFVAAVSVAAGLLIYQKKRKHSLITL